MNNGNTHWLNYNCTENPHVHRFQVWEMPLLGFGGYLPFGMECAAVAAWISPELIKLPKEEKV